MVNNMFARFPTEGHLRDHEEVEILKHEFKDVFRDCLLEGLLPKRDLGHRIENLPDAEPPHS